MLQRQNQAVLPSLSTSVRTEASGIQDWVSALWKGTFISLTPKIRVHTKSLAGNSLLTCLQVKKLILGNIPQKAKTQPPLAP